jgi:REP element-mobilizing transposase RayT
MSIPHHRRSIRLPGHDYASAGAYFVTLLVHHREPLFGTLANGDVHLTAWGSLARSEWQRLPARFAGIQIDTYIIMPDHMHAILWITDAATQSLSGARLLQPFKADAPSPASPLPASVKVSSLGTVVGAYKATTARLINALRRSPGAPVWQRNYFERIIRDEEELARITDYILANPTRTDEDLDLFPG